MRAILRIFPLKTYRTIIDRERAVLVYSISVLMLVGVLFFIITTGLLGGSTVIQRYASSAILLWAAALVFSAMLSIALTRIGRMRLGSLVVVVVSAVVLNFPAIQTGYYNTGQVLLIAFVVLMAALLLGNLGVIVGGILAISFLVLGYIVRVNLPPPDASNNLSAFTNSLVMLGLILVVTYLFLRYARLSRAEGVMVTQEDRFRLTEITNRVTQQIARRSDLSEVLSMAVELVRDSYPDIYHAQIFLIDSSAGMARLTASTGEVGRMLIQRQHSLPVGSQSVIGQVTATGKPVVARANTEQTIHKRNEFLPDTAVEAAFPLRLGDELIGVLDLQSKLEDVFFEEEMPVFQSLADHIAIAIDNARLFEETAARLRDNQRLVEQTRLTAREVERLNQRLTGRFWEEYLQQTTIPGLGMNMTDMMAVPQSEWTPTLQQAVRFNHLVQEQESSGAQIVAVPLRVRGQVIGAMEFELDSSGNLSPEDVTLLEQVGEQLGMAAETNRLFESSQRLAQREALVNEIATRLQTSSSVEMTLNVAARSLKEALKAERVSIRLGARPADGNSAPAGNEGAQ